MDSELITKHTKKVKGLVDEINASKKYVKDCIREQLDGMFIDDFKSMTKEKWMELKSYPYAIVDAKCDRNGKYFIFNYHLLKYSENRYEYGFGRYYKDAIKMVEYNFSSDSGLEKMIKDLDHYMKYQMSYEAYMEHLREKKKAIKNL
jgi:hypothetical protein